MSSILKVDTLQDSGGNTLIVSNGSGTLTTNNVGLANWSESSGNLLPSNASYGIYLGVNSATAANLLDDYEEGTFTPVLNFGGGTTGITYTQQFGGYTKIGNIVHIKMRIKLSSKGSSTGDAQITGLPFAPADNFTSVSFEVGKEIDTWTDMATASNYRYQYLDTSVMQLKRIDSNATQSFNQQVSNSDFNDTSDIRMTFSFLT
jgi:hypothetical protein